MEDHNQKRLDRSLMGRFVTCNPWYLVSTVLVLAGVALVVRGDRFFTSYVAQVGFNFTSIQLYELCLVMAAVLLVKFRIQYDALLLVIIEIVFWMIPFVLLNCVVFSGQYGEQNAILTDHLAPWQLISLYVLVSLCFWAGRYWVLRKAYNRLDIGADFLLLAIPVITINIAIPFIFRYTFNLEDEGMKDGLGVILGWLFCMVAPALAIFPNIRPSSVTKWPAELERQPWVQFFAVITLCVMTVFHLVWIDFLYDLETEPIFIVPFIWVLIWTFWNRVNDYSPANAASVRYWLLFVPALVTPWLLSPSNGYLAVVPVLGNGLIYGYLYVRRRYVVLSGRLALLSTISLIVFMVPEFITMGPQLPMFKPTFAAVLILGSVVALTVHNPIGGVFGAVGVAGLLLKFMPFSGQMWEPSVSIGLGVFLLHSCLWDRACEYWQTVRLSSIVVMISMGLMLCGNTWLNLGIHVAVMLAVVVSWWTVVLTLHRKDLLLSLKIMHAGPLVLLVKGVKELISLKAYGPVVMVGAFIVFGIGLWVSLRKRKTHTETLHGIVDKTGV